MRSTRAVCGSIRRSVASNSSLTQNAVLGRDDAARAVTDADGGGYRTGCPVELGDGLIQRVGHPHRAGGDRDARGPGTDGHRAAGLAGGRVDPLDRAVLTVRDPDSASPGHDAVRASANLDTLLRHITGHGIDPVHGAVTLVGHPHGAAPGRDGHREVTDLDRIDSPVGHGADPCHRPVAAVGDPYVRAGDGRRGRRGPDRDLLHGMGGRVDPGQRAARAAHHPDRPVAISQARRTAHAHRGARQFPGRADQAHAVGRQACWLARPRPGHDDDARGRGDRQRRADGQQAPGAPGRVRLAAWRGSPGRRCGRRGHRRGAGVRGVAVGRDLAVTVPVQRRVLGQHGGVQASQRLAGVDAELAGQQVADPPVGGQRVGLPPAPVQRQHQLAVQPLPHRMPGGQLLQLGGQRVMPAQRQVRVDPGLGRGQPQLLQPGRFRPGERVVGQVGQHPAAPQAQRLVKRPGGLGVPARLQRRPPGGESVLEPRRVQPPAVHAQQVPVVPSHQDLSRRAPGPARLQRLAQVRDVDLHGGDPPLGRVTGPEVLGQPVQRDHPVRLEQQQREHRPLPRAAQRHRTSAPDDLQRSQNAELRELRLAGHRVSSHRTHPARLFHPAARASGFSPIPPLFQAADPGISQGNSRPPAVPCRYGQRNTPSGNARHPAEGARQMIHQSAPARPRRVRGGIARICSWAAGLAAAAIASLAGAPAALAVVLPPPGGDAGTPPLPPPPTAPAAAHLPLWAVVTIVAATAALSVATTLITLALEHRRRARRTPAARVGPPAGPQTPSATAASSAGQDDILSSHQHLTDSR